MKVGDYVRTDKGEIGKLEELKLNYTKGKRLVTYYTTREVEESFVMFDNTNITQRFVDGSCYYLTDDELKLVEESIIKSSPNIIDLIEVGDYVNGYPVEKVYQPINEELGKIVRFATDNTSGWEYEAEEIYERDIKSIVTKEQFEEMEYKI